MTRIKFISKNSKEVQFSKEVRKNVRAYFKDGKIPTHGGVKMYLKSVIMLALYLIPFIILLTVGLSPWLMFSMVILMGVGEAGIGMSVMHDAAHGSYSNKNWVNKIMATSMFLLGSNTLNWKIQHNMNHHSDTNIYDYDPDIETKAIIRLSDHAPLSKFNKYQQYYTFPLYGLMTIFRFFTEINILIDYSKEGAVERMKANPRSELVKLILIKIIYLFCIIGLPFILTDFTIWQILLGFTIMHLVAGMIMSTVFQMAHVVMGIDQPLPENGIIHSDRFAHQLQTASDFGKKSGLLSWYIGGLDFQVEHHLFPSISHIHYAAIAPIVEKTAIEFGLTYNSNRTFAHALVSHFKRLKELGRN